MPNQKILKMKKIALLVSILLFAFNAGAQNITKMAPQIIIVNLGKKNPTFDESIYPHLKFFYTPGIKAVITDENQINKNFSVSGQPEFLVKAFNKHHIKQNGFTLFDKNGICYAEGDDFFEKTDIGEASCSNGKTLAENLKNIVKKGKTAKVSQSPIPWDKGNKHLKVGLNHTDIVKSQFLTGHPFPDDVKVQNSDGKEVVLEEVIKGKPTMVVFMYIPPEGNLETLIKYYKGNDPKPSKAIQKKYVNNVLYLSMLEGQFFKFNPKKALKEKYK